MESGFYSRYFVVPKKNGGLRPILDLRRLNLALRVSKFKMLTVKSILSQIQPGDWFVTIDLKDAYFHIQIVKRHRKLLRFAFESKAYQYCVLPFGLALAPRTFTKCMDAALAPLRLQGIPILNYLDDCLILAQSQDQALTHRDLVLHHLRSLGLRTNLQKSVLLPRQRTTFLGVVMDSRTMRACLSPTRVQSLETCLNQFKTGRLVHVGLCLRLLGLMAAASPAVQLGLLHMRPSQWWTKSQNISPHCHPLRRITVTCRGFRALKPWKRSQFLQEGAPDGLGGGPFRTSSPWNLDRRTSELAHKSFGTIGSLPCSQTVLTTVERLALETEPGGRGMEITPPGGESHMAEVQPSGSGSVRFKHDYALPALVFPVSSIASRSGCSGPQLSQNQCVCFSPYLAAPSCSAQSTIRQSGAPAVSYPVVAHPVMVLDPGQFVDRPSLGGSPQTRSVDTSSGHDLASSAGIMEVMGVAPEKNALMCSGLSAETTDTIIKGIVHFEIKIWYLSAYPKGIQDVGVFFSSVDPILMFLGQTVLVCQSYNGRYRSLSL